MANPILTNMRPPLSWVPPAIRAAAVIKREKVEIPREIRHDLLQEGEKVRMRGIAAVVTVYAGMWI